MNKAMQLIGIILLGSFTLVIIYLMSDVRSTNELDYYLLQEVTEAAMYDSVDYSYYRDTGLLKVDRDMFLENFNRRFAQSVSNNRDYDIRIIDFNETPPKVSVEAKTNTIASVKGETAVIVSQVSGILETIYDDLVMSKGLYKETQVDTTPPTIEKTEKDSSYVITMHDNITLDEYCIGYLPKEVNEFDKNKLKSLRCYRDISGKTDATITRPFYSSNTDNEWIIVYDGTGNNSYVTLNNGKPFIHYYHYTDDSLKLVLYDDIKVSSYAIGIDNSDISSLNWINAGENRRENGYMAANVTISNFKKNYALTGTHDYYIYVKDNTNLVSAYKKITITKTDVGNAPTVALSYSKDTKKLLITLKDIDGDLDYYIFNNHRYSLNGYELSMTQSIPSTGTYEVTVYDKMGNSATAKKEITTKLELYNSVEGYTLAMGEIWIENCWVDDNNNIQGCYDYVGKINENTTWNNTYRADFTNYSKLTIKFKQDMWQANGTGMIALHDIFGIDIGGKKTVLSHWDRRVENNQVISQTFGGYTALNNGQSMNTDVITAEIDISDITGNQILKFYLDAQSHQLKMNAQIYSIILE